MGVINSLKKINYSNETYSYFNCYFIKPSDSHITNSINIFSFKPGVYLVL